MNGASKLHKLRTMHLFAGAGGGILADVLSGFTPVCAVEKDIYCQQVISARQKDGSLPWFPIFDDVQTFDGIPWRGLVDLVAGGFPCQDISVAGKGAGIDGERSGMWRHMARIIGEVRPRYVFVENSPMLVHRGLARVLADLSQMGYDSRWCIMGADDAGAPHRRKRIWILAYAMQSDVSKKDYRRPEFEQKGRKIRLVSNSEGENLADDNSAQWKRNGFTSRKIAAHPIADASSAWWRYDPAEAPEPRMGRMADGVAYRVDRLKAIGNGQVPSVAARAWRILSEAI